MPSSLLLRFEHSAFLQKLHSLFRAVSSRYHPLYRSRIVYLFIYYVLFITCSVPVFAGRFERSAFLQKLTHSLLRAVSSRFPSLYRSRILAFIFIYLHLFIYIYVFVFFITCPVPSCWSLRALGLLAKADPLSASRRLESLHLFVQALPSLRI